MGNKRIIEYNRNREMRGGEKKRKGGCSEILGLDVLGSTRAIAINRNYIKRPDCLINN